MCGNNSKKREKESGDRLGAEEGENDGLTGPARCWLGEAVLRKGWEISTVNFVGSICTAPFVESQCVQEGGLIICSPVPRPGPRQLALSPSNSYDMEDGKFPFCTCWKHDR